MRERFRYTGEQSAECCPVAEKERSRTNGRSLGDYLDGYDG